MKKRLANNYFQFKQFRVQQDRCAMKVCTDSCILGAYASYPSPNAILDIGTGTGLLSLMIAQRHNAPVYAVEIDEEALLQARENFIQSPWSHQLFLHHTPIQQFAPDQKFDLIAVNPPFYPKHLQSPDNKRNDAMHQSALSFEELANAIANNLTANGKAYVLLPIRQTNEFINKAQKAGMHIVQQLLIKDQARLHYHRAITVFQLHKIQKPAIEELVIKENSGSYSAAFASLMKEYYLIF